VPVKVLTTPTRICPRSRATSLLDEHGRALVRRAVRRSTLGGRIDDISDDVTTRLDPSCENTAFRGADLVVEAAQECEPDQSFDAPSFRKILSVDAIVVFAVPEA
jgi:hypothetical protein